MRAGRQTTLRSDVTLSGLGVHSNLPVNLTIQSAPANSGIVFVRSVGGEEREVRVAPGAVNATDFAMVLGDASGPVVSTVEHLLAALSGLGVDNAVVEIDGPEIPILDGSAAPFVAAIDAIGVTTLPAARRYLKVLKAVRVVAGSSVGELRPNEAGLRLEIEIDFAHAAIGRQSIALDVNPVSFRRQVARARTFGFVRDVEHLWRDGYALGATLENTLVVGDDRVVNPGGLRFTDEFVRHKALDAIGDLALAGMPILGSYRSTRGGHRLNYAVLTALMADASAYEVVEPSVAPEIREPIWRARGHREVAALAQPALAPDVS